MKGIDGTEYEVAAYTERATIEAWRTRGLQLPLVELYSDNPDDTYEARYMYRYLTASEARQLAADLVRLADAISSESGE